MLLVTSQRVDLKNCTILHTVPKRWGMSKKEKNDFSSSGHFACQRQIMFHVGTLAKGILHNCGIFIYRAWKLILNSGTLCTEWRTDRAVKKKSQMVREAPLKGLKVYFGRGPIVKYFYFFRLGSCF